MARTPGPIWVEVNSELSSEPGFVCLKDDLKAAYFLWALRYPDGNLGPAKHLGLAIGKPMPKAAAMMVELFKAGYLSRTAGGKYILAAGWVREHKTSSSRVAKLRAKPVAPLDNENGSAFETPIVTLHTALQSRSNDVSNGVSETPQKEFPPRTPLRKTTTNPEVGFVESARDRAPHSGKSLLSRDYWPEDRVVPDRWLRTAEAQRRMASMPPVDLGLVAKKFELHFGAQRNQPRTETEWQAQFFKFALSERGGVSNVTRNRTSVGDTLRNLASIAAGALAGDDDGLGSGTVIVAS